MRRAALAWLGVVTALWIGGCANLGPSTQGSAPLVIDDSQRSRSQDSRVQFLVLHFTNETLERSLQILTTGAVSAHYLVTDEAQPRILRLVDEERRAWHAGVSWWRGTRGLNAASIGIEIVYPGLVRGERGMEYPPYPSAQVEAVVALVQDIVRRHQIRPERVVGHSDIAPLRRSDPGPMFPWKRLADLGLVVWPDAEAVAVQQARYEAALPDVAWFQQQLSTFGFEPMSSGQLDALTRRSLVAFQMKYRPERFDGVPDARTAALLWVLNNPAPAAKP